MLDAVEPARLPRGRLLYRERADAPYVIVVAAGIGGYWIVEDGWSRQSKCAGPFLPDEALRALRLANTFVPDGCELGPWQSGLALFRSTELPVHPNELSRLAPARLPPGTAFYRGADLDAVVNERCCSPSAERPMVRPCETLAFAVSEIEALVRAQQDVHELRFVGLLRREWNAHPEGSPVCVVAAGLDGDFAVVDLPPES
jgi:hypothetical protein